MVPVSICTPPQVFGLNDMKHLLYFKISLCSERFVVLLLGDSPPASEFYMPTFRNALSVPSS